VSLGEEPHRATFVQDANGVMQPFAIRDVWVNTELADLREEPIEGRDKRRLGCE
jgi:hypothetical protein